MPGMDPPYVQVGTAAEAEAELEKRGDWIVASLRQSVGWTSDPTTVTHAGRTFVLMPETEKYLPAIALRAGAQNGRRAILQFASAFAWSGGGDVTIESWGGGSHPTRTWKNSGFNQVTRARFQIDYLPAPQGQNGYLALALYHEALSLMHVHVAYSFLSFYKIVNLVSGQSGQKQKAWINAHLDDVLKEHRASTRVKELQQQGVDVGEYIYASCRCAIAHAGDPRNPVIDPHNLEDERRLNADLPVAMTLAELALERDLGIKTARTVYREHRYELSGFEHFFAAGDVERLREKQKPTSGATVPAAFDVRICGNEPYAPLSGVKPQSAAVGEGVVIFQCLSPSGRYIIEIVLNFPEYRLTVEVGGSENLKDDDSEGFIQETLELERFYWDWNCNGRLEVWAKGECLGRCDAFMPMNVIMDPKGYNGRREELLAEIQRRRVQNSGDPSVRI